MLKQCEVYTFIRTIDQTGDLLYIDTDQNTHQVPTINKPDL